MNGLKTFYEQLRNADRDIFLQLISEFSTTISHSIKESIQEELEEVIKKIDKVNAERESLGNSAEMFSKFSKELYKFGKKSDVALEVVLLKQFFNTEEDKIRKKIADLRPNELLKYKYELKTKLREMDDRMVSFSKVNHVMHLILRKKEKSNGESAITVKRCDR